MNQLNTYLLFFCLIAIFSSCSIGINKNFNYEQTISPEKMSEDIEDVKQSLIKRHYDVNWEGRQSEIFESLDAIKSIGHSITLDSFERRLSAIINGLDDGHSRVIHQDDSKLEKRNQFGFQSISDSVVYVRIGNFMDGQNMLEYLNRFRTSYNVHQQKYVIVDIRSNRGGDIQAVNRALTYFLPSKTKLYDKVDAKAKSKLHSIFTKGLTIKQNLRYFKYTGKKKIKGSPKIYLWVDDKIVSGSMLFTYHLQNNGAHVVGEVPKSLFNTFGNTIGFKLKHSKIVYALATARVLINEDESDRKADMLVPDYVPETAWGLSDLVDYIEQKMN